MAETLYYHPGTGALSAAPLDGCVALPEEYAPGTHAPALVQCRLHGRYEPVAKIPRLGARLLSAEAPAFRGFLLALTAAAARDRAGFRATAAALARVIAEPAGMGGCGDPAAPLAMWGAIERAFGMPLPIAVRWLAALPLPDVPACMARWGRMILRQDGGIVRAFSAHRRPPRGSAVLRADRDWIIKPLDSGRWTVYAQLPIRASWGAGSEWIYTLGTVLLARACVTCEEYQLRVRLLDLPILEMWTWEGDGLAYLRYFRDAAAAIGRVLDPGWSTARLVERAMAGRE